MKLKKLSLFLFAITAFVLLLAATNLTVSAEKVAYPVEGGNIYFNTETGAIVGCDPTITRADIPEYIDGVKVTSIDALAFTQSGTFESGTACGVVGTPSLKYVSIPGTVKYIGQCAFYGSSIESIVIPNSITGFGTSGRPNYTIAAFWGGPDTMYYRGTKADFERSLNGYYLGGIKIVLEYTCEAPYGHSFDTWNITVAQTCTEEGEEHSVCSYCQSETKTRAIPVHSWDNILTTVEPTCTKKGQQLKTCTVCNATETQSIPSAGGHKWNEWTVTVEPTSDTDGKKFRTCTVCGASDSRIMFTNGNIGYSVEGGYIYFNPKTGAIVGCDPTITRADIPPYIDGIKVVGIGNFAFLQSIFPIETTPSLKYISLPDTITYLGMCPFYGTSIESIVLPESLRSLTEASYPNELCTSGSLAGGPDIAYYRGTKEKWIVSVESIGYGNCPIVYDYKCEGIYGHEYSDWTAVTFPTCTEKGEDIRTCSLCGESETRTVSARHTWSDVITAIKPSCTTTGSGVKSCVNCDVSQTVVLPVEHSFGEWQVIQDYGCIEGIKRRTCTICKTKEEEMLPATEDHAWSDWKEYKTATCTVEGEETRYCLDCSYIESRTVPTNDNHSWSDWVTTIAPTTETEGKEVRLCTVCGETESRIVTLTCNHSFGEWTITVVPCHGDGEKVRTCSVCGESETRVIPTTGNHTYGEWILYREPDCEINGLYVSTCIYCEYKQYRTIDPIGHDYGAWTLIVPPTCFEDGLEIRICSVCGAEKQRAVSSDTVHKWSEWEIVLNPTCVDSGISTRSCKLCSKAEEKSVDPTQEHVYGNWNVIRDPTCTKSGLDERFCLECNAGKQTRYTFPTGKHIYDDSIVIPPACEADVSVTKTCTQCGMRETFVYPATGHNPVTEIVVSPTCTIEGVFKIYCRNCNTVLFTDVIGKASHSFGEWIVTVPASCTVDGEEFRECENCGASEVQAIPATGEHSFGEWKVTTPASCDLPGEATRECENCDASESREIEPIAHTEVHIELKDPTCVEDGNIEYYYCSVCGYHRTPDGLPTNRFNVILPATGEHSFGEWIVTIPASCTVDGEESRKCENCDAFEAQAIPATGVHTFGEWSVTAESTVFDAGEQSRSCSVCGETETEELAKLEMTNPFTDVSDGKWYTDGILYCYYKGYMAGVSEDIFGYKESVTRAMFVTVLAKIDGADLSAYTDTSFSDVKPGQWYSSSIEWAYRNGYAAGIGDGAFGYKQNVSREQLAMFLYTYSEKNGVDVSRREDISKFADADRIHSYALDAVKWAVHCDLISGTSDTTLSPRDSATRAEIALIVMNYVEKVKAPAA